MSAATPQLPKVFLYGDSEPDVGLDTLNIEPIRERSRRHDWIIHPHMHPDHAQLLLFTGGGANVQIEGEVLEAQAGSLIVHPAGMVHEIRYHPDTEGLTVTVAIPYVDAIVRDDPNLFAFLQTAGCFDLGDSAFGSDVTKAFIRILEESQRRESGWRMMVRGHFLTALVALSRLSQHGVHEGAGSRDRELAMGLRSLVEDHFRDHKKMTFYANALAVSPQRLNAACNMSIGRRASDLLHERLMIEARRNLAYTEMTVAEIGYDLGFEDPAYFSRFFTKRAGQPPGAWRVEFTATKRVSDGGTVE